MSSLAPVGTTYSSEDTEIQEESKRLWLELDSLAVSDPEKYKEFVNKNMKEAVEWAKVNEYGVIQPGFAIKCEAARGCSRSTRRQYINICKSVKIECPKDEELCNWKSSATLPMFLDDPRYRYDVHNEPYVVYDIIVNPVVFDKMQIENDFMEAVIELIMVSVRKTFNVNLKKKFKVLNINYKGQFIWEKTGKKIENDTYDSKLRSRDEILETVLKGRDSASRFSELPLHENDFQKKRTLVKLVPKVKVVGCSLIISLPDEKNAKVFNLYVVSDTSILLETPRYIMYFENEFAFNGVSAQFDVSDQTLHITLKPK